MQPSRASQSNKDGGARGDHHRRGAGRGVVRSCTVSCTPHPHHRGRGGGKTGRALHITLYITIHSLSRVPGNFLQTFEAMEALKMVDIMDLNLDGTCHFCKERRRGDGWISSLPANVTGEVEDTDGGTIPISASVYLSKGGNTEKDRAFAILHFRPVELSNGEPAGVSGPVVLFPHFEYCPFCGRRLDDAQDD